MTVAVSVKRGVPRELSNNVWQSRHGWSPGGKRSVISEIFHDSSLMVWLFRRDYYD